MSIRMQLLLCACAVYLCVNVYRQICMYFSQTTAIPTGFIHTAFDFDTIKYIKEKYIYSLYYSDTTHRSRPHMHAYIYAISITY